MATGCDTWATRLRVRSSRVMPLATTCRRLIESAGRTVIAIAVPEARAQVENVPVSNQVYEFLDRLAKGRAPLHAVVLVLDVPLAQGGERG